MLIRVFSDLHGVLPIIEPCDVLLIVGDVTKITDEHTLAEQEAFIGGKFSEWLRQVPAKQIILVPGNHDFCFENKEPEDFFGFPAKVLIDAGVEITPDLQVIPLDEKRQWDNYDRSKKAMFSSYENKNLKIWGSPWVPNLRNWAFFAEPYKLQGLASKIPPGMDIWMQHGPPFMYLDELASNYKHVGNTQIKYAMSDKPPQLYVCGHIHEAYGFQMHNDTQIANVSFLDERYKVRHRHMVWNFVDGKLIRNQREEAGTGKLYYSCFDDPGVDFSW